MSDFAVLVLAGGILFVVFWLIIVWLAFHYARIGERDRTEPDPHEEVHGDVVKPPPAAWRGK